MVDGKRISKQEEQAIKVDLRSGLFTSDEIANKHHISRAALSRIKQRTLPVNVKRKVGARKAAPISGNAELEMLGPEPLTAKHEPPTGRPGGFAVSVNAHRAEAARLETAKLEKQVAGQLSRYHRAQVAAAKAFVKVMESGE